MHPILRMASFNLNSFVLKWLITPTTGIIAAVCGGVNKLPVPQISTRLDLRPISSSVSRNAHSMKSSLSSLMPPGNEIWLICLLNIRERLIELSKYFFLSVSQLALKN
uniref:Uncharacterized protein n=1 Tax=Glossina brevipalpis TaxID=37001 RepID=A0A1A9W796_9MUSC